MENLEYIDDYFGRNVSDAEKKDFELRCESDKGFAEDVAFYIMAREEAKAALLKQKQAEWDPQENNKDKETFFIKPFERIPAYKWWYAAAACLALVFGTYFFESRSSPEQLADNYINKNFSQLSITMDGGKDSMQRAIADYNNKHFDKALPVFEALYKSHPDNSDALKDAGIVYLVSKNYDKALQVFDELENKKLFSNPGTFYKALTLLRRNKEGDKAAAKQLLEQVQQEHLENSKEAEEWLRKF
jgi:hypothetical protein